MRNRLILALGTATALLAALPVATAAAAATPHVLTINSVGGPAVKVGDILKAPLKATTKAKFVDPANTTVGVFCSTASVRNKVTVNPLKPGIAVESLTNQTFSNCTTNIPGATGVQSVTVNNLPYRTAISDATGFPITVTKPTSVLKTTIVINTVLGTITCTYSKTRLNGNASNTGSTNIFKNQVFTKSAGPSACTAKGSFSATFGPFRDFSVGTTTHPRVFVN